MEAGNVEAANLAVYLQGEENDISEGENVLDRAVSTPTNAGVPFGSFGDNRRWQIIIGAGQRKCFSVQLHLIEIAD